MPWSAEKIREYRRHGDGRDKKRAADKAYQQANKDKIRQRVIDKEPRPNKPNTMQCKNCGLEKEFNEVNFQYRPGNKYKLAYECRECQNKRSLNWQTVKRYSMTQEEAIEFRSHKSCAICGSAKKLHIDHCHKSGKVRGTLCSKCNTAIGMMDEDPSRMRGAAIYIEMHSDD